MKRQLILAALAALVMISGCGDSQPEPKATNAPAAKVQPAKAEAQNPVQIIHRVKAQIEGAADPVDFMLGKLAGKIKAVNAGKLAAVDLVVYAQEVEDACKQMALTAGSVKTPKGLPAGVAEKVGEYLMETKNAYAKRQSAMEALITLLTQNDAAAGRKYKGRMATANLHIQAAHAALKSAEEKARAGS